MLSRRLFHPQLLLSFGALLCSAVAESTQDVLAWDIGLGDAEPDVISHSVEHEDDFDLDFEHDDQDHDYNYFDLYSDPYNESEFDSYNLDYYEHDGAIVGIKYQGYWWDVIVSNESISACDEAGSIVAEWIHKAKLITRVEENLYDRGRFADMETAYEEVIEPTKQAVGSSVKDVCLPYLDEAVEQEERDEWSFYDNFPRTRNTNLWDYLYPGYTERPTFAILTEDGQIKCNVSQQDERTSSRYGQRPQNLVPMKETLPYLNGYPIVEAKEVSGVKRVRGSQTLFRVKVEGFGKERFLLRLFEGSESGEDVLKDLGVFTSLSKLPEFKSFIPEPLAMVKSPDDKLMAIILPNYKIDQFLSAHLMRGSWAERMRLLEQLNVKLPSLVQASTLEESELLQALSFVDKSGNIVLYTIINEFRAFEPDQDHYRWNHYSWRTPETAESHRMQWIGSVYRYLQADEARGEEAANRLFPNVGGVDLWAMESDDDICFKNEEGLPSDPSAKLPDHFGKTKSWKSRLR